LAEKCALGLDAVDVDAILSRRAGAGESAVYSFETQRPHPAGHEVALLVTVRLIGDADGDPSHLSLAVQDLTERRRVEAELTRRALHDELTGLASRSLFLDRLRHALAGARRRNSSVAVLFVDVDGFKEINDRHGHAAGDAVLTAIAGRLETELRSADSLSRFGGDEFVVLQEDAATVADAILIGERLQATIRAPFSTPTGPLTVAASIGVAISQSAVHEEPQALIARADAAMYRAKLNSGDQCAI
jgi:diguanylate cyclase (GGDEF)-like protein